MPHEPTLQTLHIASVSFNSLLLGEIVVPDWDMFHVSTPLKYGVVELLREKSSFLHPRLQLSSYCHGFYVL